MNIEPIPPRGGAEFSRYCLTLLRANGSASTLRGLADDRVLTSRVSDVLKEASIAGNTLDPDWASQLTAYADIATAFLASLRELSVFDRVAADAVQMPARTDAALVILAGTATQVEEGRAIPVPTLKLGTSKLAEYRSAAILVVTAELVKTASPLGLRLLQQELRNAVAEATDRIFLTQLLAGISPAVSAGGTAANLAADLRALLTAIRPKAGAKLFWLMDATTATEISTKVDTAGAPLHPAMGATGGELLALPALVSDAVPRDSDGGTLVLLDAQRIGVDAGILTADSSGEALLQMSTTPDEPTSAATILTSLFQRNLRALRVQRVFGFEPVRPNAIAALTAVNY